VDEKSESHIKIKRIASALGAEVDGVDISQPLDSETIAEIRQALLDHLVIFLRNQTVTPQQLLDFGRHYGEPMEYPQTKGLPECPLVIPVIKLENETVNFGGVWHSDTTYLPQPPMASLLYAVEVPPSGGDTLFANQYLAHDALSKGLKKSLASLTGINTSAIPAMASTRKHRQADDGVSLQVLSAPHPVLRTHPETGRKSLYVNCAHTSRFEGWTELESRSILDHLFAHQIQPEFTCRLQWETGTLAMWDNRCTQHYPMNDYHGHKRLMHRITLTGDVPR
jgi:taurine dioxygenase